MLRDYGAPLVDFGLFTVMALAILLVLGVLIAFLVELFVEIAGRWQNRQF